MRFDGKAVLVTGGATGIGRAAATAFAREGARVMIGDVDARAEETVAAIRGEGGDAAFVHADVADEQSVDALVAACLERFGGLHAAFNNAGVLCTPLPLHQMPLADYERTMAVNARGVFLAMRAELRHMLTAGGGAIVNTASVGGVIANPDMAPYVASKHAVVGLTRSAAIEYARAGIRVNAICPGFVKTPMTAHWQENPAFLDAFFAASPAGRAAEPEEIAGTVLHLCSADASFTNGSIVIIDGGQTAI